MKLTKKEKIQLVEEALQVITIHCPCYGAREEDPVNIVIGNGLQLRDKNYRFITSGTNAVAKKLVERYVSNVKK